MPQQGYESGPVEVQHLLDLGPGGYPFRGSLQQRVDPFGREPVVDWPVADRAGRNHDQFGLLSSLGAVSGWSVDSSGEMWYRWSRPAVNIATWYEGFDLGGLAETSGLDQRWKLDSFLASAVGHAEEDDRGAGV